MPDDLENLYRTHRQGLFALAMSVTRCVARAEDAVHEAFARLWRRRQRPRGELVPYVFAAVRNAALDQVRRNGRPTLPDSVLAEVAGGGDPAELAEMAERRELLRRALDALPDAQREVVVLRAYAGLTFEQIARVLDEPLATVASRYRRALDRLREQCGRLV